MRFGIRNWFTGDPETDMWREIGAQIAIAKAQGMEAAKPARRTEDCGSTEGDSPVRKADAPK